MVSLVDLAGGQVIWQTTGVGAVAGQSFRTALWSTDGQYLIAQAQLPQQSSFYRNVGVWRWQADQRRLILVQEVPSSGLLGVSPNTGDCWRVIRASLLPIGRTSIRSWPIPGSCRRTYRHPACSIAH